MESAFIIVGTVALWGYLASRSSNPYLKTFMMLETLLMTVAMGWIVWMAEVQSLMDALNTWRYVVSMVFLGWIGVYGGLWITGALEKEEVDNEF